MAGDRLEELRARSRLGCACVRCWALAEIERLRARIEALEGEASMARAVAGCTDFVDRDIRDNADPDRLRFLLQAAGIKHEELATAIAIAKRREGELRDLCEQWRGRWSGLLAEAEKYFFAGDKVAENHMATCARQWDTAVKEFAAALGGKGAAG